MGLADDGSSKQMGSLAERIRAIKDLGLPDASLERFVERHEIEVQQRSDSVRENIVQALTDDQFNELLRQFRYAGQQTINYFVITGVSGYRFELVIEKIAEKSDTEEEMEGVSREPYLANHETADGYLYLSFGYFDSTGSEDPATGQLTYEFVQRRVIAVINDSSDLVQIRASDTKMARKVRDLIGRALGITSDDALYRPKFGISFQKEFGDELVSKYYNLRIRVDDEEGSTIDTIQFTSKTDESGERRDAREDERVSTELEDRGGEITMGYVELDDGSKFYINRKESRLSFQRHETENKLNEITKVIHDVLKETGGFEQRKLAGIENVPD